MKLQTRYFLTFVSLLLNIYVNYIANINQLRTFQLFTDDTYIYITGTNNKELIIIG